MIDEKSYRITLSILIFKKNKFILMEIKTDKGKKRATFGLKYPTEQFTLEKNNENKELSNVDITFNTIYSNVLDTNFTNCRFNNKGKHRVEIADFSFKDCKFKKCFLGSCEFLDMKFENCQFEKCDFMNTKFNRCIFKNCTFSNCSAMHLKIEMTELNSKSFLNSLVLLAENYKENDEEYQKDLIKFNENNVNLAKSIYRSNDQLADSILVDESLFILKKIEVENGFKKYKWYQQEFWNIVFEWINLFSSKGGTSLKRLLWIGICFLLIFASLLKYSGIKFVINEISYPIGFSLPRTFSIFLGFGFTNYKTGTFYDLLLMIFCSGLGLLWYAMAIPVLIRRMHR